MLSFKIGNLLIQPTEKVCLLSFLKSDNDMNVKRLVLWHFFNMMLCTLDLVPRPTLITSITNANIGTEIKCACGINVERHVDVRGLTVCLLGKVTHGAAAILFIVMISACSPKFQIQLRFNGLSCSTRQIS